MFVYGEVGLFSFLFVFYSAEMNSSFLVSVVVYSELVLYIIEEMELFIY